MKALTREDALAIYNSGPEAVVKILCEMSQAIVELQQENRELRIRVRELEQKLAKNSRNSSKPPSTDGLLKPKPQSLRKPSGRKPGGQPGHEGSTLKMVQEPDEIQWHRAPAQCECGCPLQEEPVIDYERRQVFDLPKMDLQVTEHRVELKRCPCCAKEHKGFFPATIKACVQYGERFKALIVYLRGYQLLPSARTAELLKTIFKAPVSEGTLDTIFREAGENLSGFMRRLKEFMINAGIAHFDETGLSQNGKNHWLHTVSTPEATYYAMHPKRGTEAIEDIGILPEFQGTAIHDSWAPYFQYEQCRHGLCNAHQRSVTVGDGVVVNVNDEVLLTSKGNPAGSEVKLSQGAHMTADSMSIISGNKATLGKDTVITVRENFNMDAASAGQCSIAGTASITAGSTSGNCLP